MARGPSIMPEVDRNYGLAVDGLSSKVCLPGCRPVNPLPIGTEGLRNGTPRGNLLRGLPAGPGYFGRVSGADRLPHRTLAGAACPCSCPVLSLCPARVPSDLRYVPHVPRHISCLSRS